MTEAEATEKVLDVAWPNKESQDENEDSENKGCSMMEREKATARLCCQKWHSGCRKKEILQYLSIMEDTFLATDVACWKKQWTLEDLFKWDVELSLCRDKWGRLSLNDIHDLLLLNFKVLPHQFDTIGHGAQLTTFEQGMLDSRTWRSARLGFLDHKQTPSFTRQKHRPKCTCRWGNILLKVQKVEAKKAGTATVQNRQRQRPCIRCKMLRKLSWWKHLRILIPYYSSWCGTMQSFMDENKKWTAFSVAHVDKYTSI